MNINPMNTRKLMEMLLINENIDTLVTQQDIFDVCFVFGSRHTQLTADLVYKLWNKELFRYLIITGGKNQRTKRVESSEIHQKLFLKIPDEVMFIEPFSTNMKDNVVRSITLFKRIENLLQDTCRNSKKKINKILALTRIHTARRGLMTLKKQICSRFKQKILFKVVCFNEYTVPVHPWQQNPSFKKYILEEREKISEYLKKDDIAEIKKRKDEYWT